MLTDANFDDWQPLSPYRAVQGWDHGPVQLTRPRLTGRPGDAHVRALCLGCNKDGDPPGDWVGPARDGDPNSLRLAEDDAVWHLHNVGVLCGCCQRCVRDGALRGR